MKPITAKNTTAHPDARKIVAYRSGERKLWVASMMRAPSPRSAPIHSPTIAPSTEVVEAIFRAEKRKGSELGTRSFQNTSARLAESTRISSRDCGLTDWRPRTMFARVGKKQI